MNHYNDDEDIITDNEDSYDNTSIQSTEMTTEMQHHNIKIKIENVNNNIRSIQREIGHINGKLHLLFELIEKIFINGMYLAIIFAYSCFILVKYF